MLGYPHDYGNLFFIPVNFCLLIQVIYLILTGQSWPSWGHRAEGRTAQGTQVYEDSRQLPARDAPDPVDPDTSYSYGPTNSFFLGVIIAITTDMYIYMYNYIYIIYLVGGLEHVFPYIGNNHPN